MTLYEALKVNTSYFDHLSRLGYKSGDERYLPLYRDYLRLIGEGQKTTYIAAILSTRYGIAERTFYNVIKRFSNECNGDAL